VYELVSIYTCTWNDDFLRRSNNDLGRRRWGSRVWGFRDVFKIEILRLFLFKLCFSAAFATAFDAKDDVSKNPNEVNDDDDKNSLFNDICPPVEFVIGEVGESKRVMEYNNKDSRNIVKHGVKPPEPVLIRSNDSCPSKIDDHYKC